MSAKVNQKKIKGNLKDIHQNKLHRKDVCDISKNYSYVTRCADNVAKICDNNKFMKLINYAYAGTQLLLTINGINFNNLNTLTINGIF